MAKWKGASGMTDEEPNMITSGLSRMVSWEGYRLQIDIYRLEDRPGWTLEVVNEAGTSTVWDDMFNTDRDADAAFKDTLATEGIAAFVDGYNVLAFPTRPR